jgi:hypothetical protein
MLHTHTHTHTHTPLRVGMLSVVFATVPRNRVQL